LELDLVVLALRVVLERRVAEHLLHWLRVCIAHFFKQPVGFWQRLAVPRAGRR
jgi:hypothetical protein